MEQYKNMTLYIFMSNIIEELKQMGKIRSSETYTATLKSFMNYMQNKQIMIKDISSETMVKYEAYLQYKGLKKTAHHSICGYCALYITVLLKKK